MHCGKHTTYPFLDSKTLWMPLKGLKSSPELAFLEYLQAHVALSHIKELLALLQVVVLTLVGLPAADIKHLETIQ